MVDTILGDVAPTYAVHRDGADFNIKIGDD